MLLGQTANEDSRLITFFEMLRTFCLGSVRTHKEERSFRMNVMGILEIINLHIL